MGNHTYREQMMEARERMPLVARLVFDRLLLDEKVQRANDTDARVLAALHQVVRAPDDETAIRVLLDCLTELSAEYRRALDRLIEKDKVRLPSPIVLEGIPIDHVKLDAGREREFVILPRVEIPKTDR